MTKDKTYRATLDEVLEELHEIEEKQAELNTRRKYLQELASVLSRMYDIELPEGTTAELLPEEGLTNHISWILDSAAEPLTAVEIKQRLTDLRFDVAKYANPMAAIHTTLKRLVENGEIGYIAEDGKKIYMSRGIAKMLKSAGGKLVPVLKSKARKVKP